MGLEADALDTAVLVLLHQFEDSVRLALLGANHRHMSVIVVKQLLGFTALDLARNLEGLANVVLHLTPWAVLQEDVAIALAVDRLVNDIPGHGILTNEPIRLHDLLYVEAHIVLKLGLVGLLLDEIWLPITVLAQ